MIADPRWDCLDLVFPGLVVPAYGVAVLSEFNRPIAPVARSVIRLARPTPTNTHAKATTPSDAAIGPRTLLFPPLRAPLRRSRGSSCVSVNSMGQKPSSNIHERAIQLRESQPCIPIQNELIDGREAELADLGFVEQDGGTRYRRSECKHVIPKDRRAEGPSQRKKGPQQTTLHKQVRIPV